MVKQIPSLHPDYRECILDIDIFGRIVSSPQPSLEQLKEMLFEEYSQRTPMPTLESKRYELSRQVSDDYKVSYSGELELQDNESLVDLQRQPPGVVFEDLTSLIPGNIHSEVQECFRYEVGAHDDFRQRIVDEYDIESLEEFKPGIRATENIVGSTSEDESLILTDEEIDRLGSEPEEGQLAEFDEFGEGVTLSGDSVDDGGVDIGELPVDGQSDEEDSDEDVYDGYSDEDEEAEPEEDVDDGVDFGDLHDDGEEVDSEDGHEEPNMMEQVFDGESDEDDGVDFGEIPAEEDDGVDFGDMPPEDEVGVGEEDDGVDFGDAPDEEDAGVDFGELQPEEDEGVDFGELPPEGDSAVDFDGLPAEGVGIAEAEQEDDDDGVDFGDIQDEEEDDGVDFGDIQEDDGQEEQDDGVSFDDFGVDPEPEFIEAPAPPPPMPKSPEPTQFPPRAQVQQAVQSVVQQPAAPVIDRSSEPTDIRAFVRKHPRCDVQFALKFFTKKQIDDAVRLGRIIKKGNTLR